MQSDAWMLVIENDEDDLLLVDRARRQVAPQVAALVARSKGEALSALDAGAPILILLDVELGRRLGENVLSAVRNHPLAECAPLVCFSGCDDDDSVLSAYAGGANDFVRKSADYDVCLEALDAALRYWLGRHVVPGDCGQNRAYA